MAALPAVGGEDHADGERRAVLALAERAEVVGDALGQHRHDAVGEIDRVAALHRLAVERRAGPDIPADIGDGDGDDEAAGIGRVRVGLGVDRVVMVLGVGRVDGDERQLAPVLAALERRRLGGFRLGFSTSGGKTCGMPWAWMAIRLTAFSSFIEPTTSSITARSGPRVAGARHAHRDEVAFLRALEAVGRRSMSTRCLRSTGSIRAPPARLRGRRRASLVGFRARSLMMRAVKSAAVGARAKAGRARGRRRRRRVPGSRRAGDDDPRRRRPARPAIPPARR